MYEENIKDGSEETLADEFQFNTEMIKQKYSNEEEEIVSDQSDSICYAWEANCFQQEWSPLKIKKRLKQY